MMIARFLMAALLLAVSPALLADAITGEVEKQATNYTAIIMFVVFIVFTMGITKWAAKRNTSTADYYTAGGSITGFQNGLAIAGDFMSAASFLGISALVYTSGYDGLIYSIGFLVGWPIILFLMAERLRNLGKFTFSDVASYRLGQTQIRLLSAFGSLIVVAFYLIAQMVGAGKLIQLLFGLDYYVAVVLVGVLMVMYVLFGGMLATTWVQIIKAVLLLSGASFMAVMVMKSVGFDFGSLFAEAVKIHEKGAQIMSPGGLVSDPISAISLGLALMFGTAGLPHILMRFFTVSDAKEARNQADHPESGRGGDSARHHLREAEHRLHGGPGVLHRRQLQLPSAVPFHVLEGPEHPWCAVWWLAGAVHRVAADHHQPDRVGRRIRLRRSDLPLQVPGAVLDGCGIRRHLVLLGHRQVQTCWRGARALLRPVRSFADRPGGYWRCRALTSSRQHKRAACGLPFLMPARRAVIWLQQPHPAPILPARNRAVSPMSRGFANGIHQSDGCRSVPWHSLDSLPLPEQQKAARRCTTA